MKHGIAAAFATVYLYLVAGNASAQEFPTRAVTILVPFSAGGVVDVGVRLVGEHLSKKWRQPVVIENRAGASGMIAARAAATAKPDGYTLLGAEAGVGVINALIFKDVAYSMEKDLVPILTITDTPLVLAVNADSGLHSMKDVLIKARDNHLSYASPGRGTVNHLTAEWIAMETGAKLQHISYKGGAPAATAVAAGEVPLAVLSYSSVTSFVDSGRVKLLAVADSKRTALAPNLPTLQESGIPNVSTTQWVGFFAPAATPEAVLSKIQNDVSEILGLPEVKDKLSVLGASASPSTSAEFAARLKAERDHFQKIVKAARIDAN